MKNTNILRDFIVAVINEKLHIITLTIFIICILFTLILLWSAT